MDSSQPDPPPPCGVVVAHGARAAEAVLLSRLDHVLGTPPDPAGLARPVRVVVPSASLRLHLGARVVERRGAVAGVVVQSLFAVAAEIVERCGEAAPRRRLPGDLPFEVLVRRLAREEPELARGLDFLVDGYGAVSATVRDLLDAGGVDPVHAEAADELLEAVRDDPDLPFHATAAQVARAKALVRVAARVEAALAASGVERRSALLARATTLLADDPERALPARAVLVHGFADATGLATDLVEALLRHRDGLLILDSPPDPAALPGAATAAEDEPADGTATLSPYEDAFSERFRERLAGAAGAVEVPPPGGEPPAPRLERFAAPGGEAEAREIAVRVRRLLDAGATPERVGVVVREVAPHRLALRRHLDALAVPWSGVGAAGSLTAAGRRAHALLDLLRRRHELPADRWLDATAAVALATPGGGSPALQRGAFVDLRLALSSLGAGRLGDVGRLDVDRVLGGRPALPLPVRQGLSYAQDDEADDGRGGSPARRRSVPRAVLAAAVAAAGGVLQHLRRWPGDASPGEHLGHLRQLLLRHLLWRPDDPTGRPVLAALDTLERDLPGALALRSDELHLLLARTLEDAGRDRLGGRGGGVQVLSVIEARGRTFDHLFLAGVHRGAFPRSVRQDPLLPDDLRNALATVLPDLPRKRTGFDEERFLFAQLLSSAPRVTVSWWLHDDDDQPLSPSPLVERLPGPPAAAVPGHDDRAATGADDDGPRVPRARPLHSALPPSPGDPPRAARETAVRAALCEIPRRRLAPFLAAATAESRATLGSLALDLDPGELAGIRLRVLDEIDPDLRDEAGRARAESLGPYLGFLGAVADDRPDPRRDDPWLTHAENLAGCPWQLFLRKLLRLEPTPDPLQALPGADPLLLGNTVHRVLERLVAQAGAPVDAALDEVLDASPTAVPRPGADELDALVDAAARRVMADEGVPLPGLAHALARRARPLVERALDLDWPPGGPLAVLGAELAGAVDAESAAGRRRRLRFRTDRADVAADGRLRLTDYKTGRPLSRGKRPSTRERHHLEAVRTGSRLQATAYRLAVGHAGGEGAAEGRYLFLDPEIDAPEAAEFAVDHAAGDHADAFRTAVGTVLSAWDAGAFFPRVVDPAGEQEPARCGYCEVAEACLRGDSGARLRLARWNHDQGPTAVDEAHRAHHAAWRLPEGEGGS